LVLKEVINNALKHAKADELKLSVSLTNGVFHFIFEDNGIGFDTSAIAQGNGLENIKKRMQEIDGELTIEQLSSGTRVKGSCPCNG